MPEFVISASVYANDPSITSPEAATKYIEAFNNHWLEHGITIRLPDDHNNPEIVSSKWELVGDGDVEVVDVRMRDLEGHGNLEGR